ncbi:MAG: endonuclease NucS domain-containing protein [Candidatus Hodarchaeales archaeon]|jgi:RecB family endonuclease NucS
MRNQIDLLSRNPSILKQQLTDCTAIFDGRIKSQFEKGDRILTIKKDLAILLHSSRGLRPDQWQRAGDGKISFIIEDEKLQMQTYRPKTDESFFVTFSRIFLGISFDTIKEKKESTVFGDEKDFSNYLVKNPNMIEPGLKVTDCEKETEVGFIDILAIDTANRTVIIEVKKQAASPADAHQLKRYKDYFQSKQSEEIRAILVATGFSNKIIKYMNSVKLEYCSIPWQEIFPTVIRPSNILKVKKLDEFL